MSFTARAAVFTTPGKPMTVEEITVRPPGPGEVLVRTTAAGICGTDLHFAAGVFPYPLPTVLGHEAAGTIIATGPGVTRLTEGDQVLVCDQVFCGQCGPCLSGSMVYCANTAEAKARQRDRLTIAGAPGRQYLGVSAFAELMLVDASACLPTPELSAPAAALLACCLTTGLASVFNVARPEPGHQVAVFGCGGVGLGAIQAARIAGATEIYAVDVQEHRLNAAKQVGATVTINAASPGDTVQLIVGLSGGGVQRSIEAVGLAETAAQAFAVLAPGGSATVVGMLPPDAAVPVPGRLLRHGRQIGGTVMGSVRTLTDIPRYAAMIQSGQLLVDPLITSTTPLEDINTALDAAHRHAGIRSMISF